MNRLLSICFLLNFTVLANAQYSWILKPSQDSKTFVTPSINELDFIIVKYDDGTKKVVNSEGKTMMERGPLIMPYSYSPDDKLFRIKRSGEPFHFYDKDFNCVTTGYEQANFQQGYNTLLTTKNGLLGLMDLEGNVMIENKYKLLRRESKGRFKAIDQNDVEIILEIEDKPKPSLFPNCKILENTIYRRRRGKSNLFGIINTKGDTLLKDDKYSMTRFPRCPTTLLDSFLIVYGSTTHKMGIMNIDGEMILDTIYNKVRTVKDVPYLLNVRLDKDTYYVYDLRTKSLNNYGYDNASLRSGKHNIEVKKGSFIGNVDFEGNLLVPPIYHYVHKADNSYAFERNDSIFIYSTKENAFAQDTFTKRSVGRNNLFVLGNDKYCLYDGANLKRVSGQKYDEIRPKDEYFVGSYKTRDTVYFDPPRERKNKKGEVYRIDTMSVKRITHYDYFDNQGKWVYHTINNKLDFLTKKYSKHYISGTDTLVYVNTNSFTSQKFHKKDVSNPYDKNRKMITGVLESNSKHYILDHFLDPTIEAVAYTSLQYDKDKEIYIYEEDGKFGLLSKDGLISPPEFEQLEHRYDYEYIAMKDGKYGVLKIERD